MIIKAVSLWQPFPTFMAYGAKGIETRSWETKYRGPIAIHSTLKWNKRINMSVEDGGYYAGIMDEFSIPLPLPLGKIVAIGYLDEVKKSSEIMTKFVGENVNIWSQPYDTKWSELVLDEYKTEYMLGCYDQGYFGWYVNNVKRLDVPIPAKGYQKLWNWTVPAEHQNYISSLLNREN